MGRQFGIGSMAVNRHVPVILLALLYGCTAVVIWPNWPVPIMLAVLAVPLIWATVTDLARHVIPDTASAVVAVTGLAYPFLIGTTPEPVTLGVALLVTLVLAGTSEMFWRRHQTEALGLGDVKLIGAGTLVVGAQNLWLVIGLAAIGGIIAAVLARRNHQKGIPFGPFLAYAIFAVAAANGGEIGWH